MRYARSLLEVCVRGANGRSCWAREFWRFDSDDDLLVVGAPMGSVDAGCVLLFPRAHGAHRPASRLYPSDSTRGDDFGVQLALFEDTLVVGAPRVESAYVFARNGSVWRQVEKLHATDSVRDTRFGSAVDVASEVAVVGGERSNYSPGAASIYRRCGERWSLEQVVKPPGEGEGGAFGYAVSAFDGEIVVGAPSSTHGGSAYVYRYVRRSWRLVQILRPLESSPASEFGCHLSHALGEPLLIVGAIQSNLETPCPIAYLFRRRAYRWDPAGTVW